jgi:pyridoxine 5-phosphate synthase
LNHVQAVVATLLQLLAMAKLSVNVNKVATLRNTRDTGYPSIVRLATIALDAGAAGITVHPRPDQRHIRAGDVRDLARLLRSYPSAEFNIEGNPFHGYMELVREVRPAQCTLVPDEPEAVTSNQGWTLDARTLARLTPVVAELKSLGCRVSLFVDPDVGAMQPAATLGADRVELYTEPYAAAHAAGNGRRVADAFAAAATAARAQGLGVNAGHDLNLENLPPLIQAIPFLAEVSIGHALIGDAMEFGMAETVKRYVVAAGGGAD